MAEEQDSAALRALLADWERGDWTTAPALFAPDLYFSGAQPEGQVEARGPEGVTSFMRGFLKDWRDYHVELHDFEELGGGRYLATATQHGVGRTSELAITAPVSIAFTMREGRVAQMEWYLEREDALEALERFASA